MNAPTVIEMHAVSVGSQADPNTDVVVDVEWKVRQGEYWVVGAPQHSGKSEFLMMIGGLSVPREGDYSFLGVKMPVFDESLLAHRLKLGFVFDGGQLLSGLSVAENIALPLRYHYELSPDELDIRVTELLELTDLVAMANLAPGRIGRAWQQRAGLARALALKPELLLVDSPLTGLDVRHANWWLGFLDKLSLGHPCMDSKPLTLIITADDFRPWQGRAHQFACLSEKRLAILGDWSAVEQSHDAAVCELLNTAAKP